MDNLIPFKLPRYFILTFILILVAGLQLQTAFGQVSISGKVSDENDIGLPGTSIAVKGTSEGTIADGNGNYTIEVQDTEAVLVFTFVGYTTREIPVGNLTEINVQMTPEFLSLDQVVVVGYGTQEKRDITGAISVADVEVMNKSESFSVTNRLQGLVPGVAVVGDGEPGSIGQIRIRGNVFYGTSENPGDANNPLFVIDGVLIQMI